MPPKKIVQDIKQYYQYVVAVAMIIVLVFVVYGHDIEILANEAFQNEALSHILLAPFFAGILFYLRKDKVRASLTLEEHRKRTRAKYIDQLVGTAVCLIAFLTYWYGSHTFYSLEYHILSLPIFIFGVVLILSNFKVMTALIPPILFLFFLVPIPSQLMYTLGGEMANLNTQASYSLLKAFSLPVELSTTYGPPTITLATPQSASIPFAIDLPCSGIYSLIAFSMLAAFLALVTTASAFKKIAVVAIGFITFEILNIIRITSIIAIAYQFGQEVAMYLFHNLAGLLLIFIGMLLTLVIADKLLKVQIMPTQKSQFSCQECKTSLKKGASFCSNCGAYLARLKIRISKDFWIKLFVLAVGSFLIALSINAPTFAVAQGPGGIGYAASGGESLAAFPNITGHQPIAFLFRDDKYEAVARQDAALWYAYSPTADTQSTVYVAVNVASSISNLHNWEVCFVSWRIAEGQYPTVSVLDSRDIQILQDVPIIARYFTFISPHNYTQVTLYWYEEVPFDTGITVEQKYVRISLIILIEDPANYKQYEDELLPIGEAIAAYWQPIHNNSLISLGIPTIQSLLAASILLVAFTKTTQYFSEWKTKTNNQKIFNNLASAQEKGVLQTIQNIAKNKKTMDTHEIQEALRQNTGRSLNEDGVFSILENLEKFGFIKKDVVSVRNRPFLVWKT
jgi:exosortase